MLGKPISIEELAEQAGPGKLEISNPAATAFSAVEFDSRLITDGAHTLFIAIRSGERDGHDFIEQAAKAGVRNFLVQHEKNVPPHCNYLKVANTVSAFQQWAKRHREQFQIPVIGITGSNGKTIVKEWLASILEPYMQVVKSPKSFNSQIGVPLSVLQMNERHEIAIFEAGISRAGEMEKLAGIIRPEIGILTHFGDAHSEGFDSPQQKLSEKLKLFQSCKVILVSADDPFVLAALKATGKKIISIGSDPAASIRVLEKKETNAGWYIRLAEQKGEQEIHLNLQGHAALENMLICYAAAREAGLEPPQIAEGIASLHPVSMRTELITDNPDITILNDAYNADIASVKNAFSLLKGNHSQPGKMVIITDLEHQGTFQLRAQEQILKDAIEQFGSGNVILVGPAFHSIAKKVPGISSFYDTDELLADFDYERFRRCTVLLKGARKFHLENLVPFLSRRINATTLKINLNHLAGNFRTLRRICGTETKIMGMVKAFSYGSGSWEIAQALEKEGADYFAVAYLSEGIELRARGITKPVMVMNPDETGLAQLFHFNLEPEVFSISFLEKLAEAGKRNHQTAIPVHIKVDTGMHRLGFVATEIPALLDFLKQHPEIKVKSVFSHLVGAEDPKLDSLTLEQVKKLEAIGQMMSDSLGYLPMRHILNSAGILRFPQFAFEMVRPGLSLYGLNPAGKKWEGLEEIGSLHTIISMLREYPAGTGISYGHSQVTTRDTMIATIPIGYADGIPRSLGNGKISFLVKGKYAPTIGKICMDMLMLDVTGIEGVKPGDEVVIFGEQGNAFQSVVKLAEVAGTIPYEILAGISQRVRRVFVRE